MGGDASRRAQEDGVGDGELTEGARDGILGQECEGCREGSQATTQLLWRQLS